MPAEKIQEWVLRDQLREKENKNEEFYRIVKEKTKDTNILLVFGDNIHQETENNIDKFAENAPDQEKVVLYQEGLGKGGGGMTLPELWDAMLQYTVVAIIVEPTLTLVKNVFKKIGNALWSKILTPKVLNYKNGWYFGRSLLRVYGKVYEQNYIFPQYMSPEDREIALLKAQKHFEKNYERDDRGYYIFDLTNGEWIEF
jgi:hypothetical protein